MNASRMIWAGVGIVSLLCTALLATGFWHAVETVTTSPPSAASPEEKREVPAPPEDGVYRILALGDSLAKGTGDNSGEGFAGKVKRALDDLLDARVVLVNYGVNGYRAEQLLRDLELRDGTIAQVREAELILVSIGANDVFVLDNPTQADIDAGRAHTLKGAALERVRKIMERLHELNPRAKTVYIGLYNPFSDIEDVAEDAAQFVHEWNYSVQRMLAPYPNMALVPTYDLFQERVADWLAPDHYHPNEEGYRRIADRILQLTAGGWTHGEAER